MYVPFGWIVDAVLLPGLVLQLLAPATFGARDGRRNRMAAIVPSIVVWVTIVAIKAAFSSN
jgi:hypothetical protein